jgi:polar amino acid transport system substrate-binding protein
MYRKLLFLTGLLVLVTALLVACQPQSAAPTTAPAEPSTGVPTMPDLNGREIRIAVENAYLPFNYIDLATNEPAGWDYDVLNRICELINCKPLYLTTPWEGMIQSVANGEYDMGADGVTITEGRREIVDFSIGYISIEQRFLVRMNEDRFDSVDAFVGNPAYRLGTQSGTTNFETAQGLLPLTRVLAFDQFGFAIEALLNGDVDAVLIDETAGQGYVGVNADKLKVMGASLSSDQLGFIYPKGSDLREPIDLVLQYLMSNGELAAINEKYFTDAFTVTYDDILDPFAEE